MCIYKYIEPSTTIEYVLYVGQRDTDIISQLKIGSSVKLSTCAKLTVDDDAIVSIEEANGQKSSANLNDLKNGLVS